MNPFGGVVLLAVIVAVLFGSRRHALLAMMVGVLFVPQEVQLQIFGFNIYAARFLELAGLARILSKHELAHLRWNPVDKALVLLYGYTAIVYCLRSTTGVATQIGDSLDACLCYFIFRGLIGDIDDFRWFLRAFLAPFLLFGLLIAIECVTRYNIFVDMGATPMDWVREGRLRCQGSFRYAALLGTLGASFLPLYVGFAFDRAQRRLAWIGIGICVLIVWASNSGGPASALAVGLMGWGCWKMRKQMRVMRWGMIGMLALLAVAMKAPVWFIFDRVSSITGGDGWHRSYLIDVALRNLDKWWLAGMPVVDTSDWFTYTLTTTGGADITNQFILFGINSGIGAIILFVLLLKRLFSSLGSALANIRMKLGDLSEEEYLLWGLGVVLTVHISNLFGVTYFDQTYVVWFMQLAAIAGISQKYLDDVPEVGVIGEGSSDSDVEDGGQVFSGSVM